MFRLWARTFQNNHMLNDTVICDDRKETGGRLGGISKILMKSVCFRIGYAIIKLSRKERPKVWNFYWMQKARSKRGRK